MLNVKNILLGLLNSNKNIIIKYNYIYFSHRRGGYPFLDKITAPMINDAHAIVPAIYIVF
jgi:hypothetical protein